MASMLRIGATRSHAVGFEARSCSGLKSESELQSSVSFRGRTLRNAVPKVSGRTSVAAVRAALMQAAPLPMRSCETRMR